MPDEVMKNKYVDRDFIEENIWVNKKGDIVYNSRVGNIEDLIPFIEDNIYYSGDSQDDDGDKINWTQVWKDYDLTPQPLKKEI